ncbi:hypothetical protein P8C59_006131 [Phyllachora maydis]|uniref:Uncharacterized protein n=1 Tax=Phyllachora maydis TaxID=1825666 RepID=A0AAD9I7K7_9PEZI|nr:hypothetical protein P8C59_006131 [Phyllachora maydis]
MPSMLKSVGVAVAGLAAMSSALPAQPKFTRSQMKIHEFMKRQSAAETAAGLTDIEILQLALTIEWLETSFYQQGFQKFSNQDFLNLGLSNEQVTDFINVGQDEQAHVTLLLNTISQAGTQPVQPCTYQFNFTDAGGMVATAGMLENIGISAYLGAAPLLSNTNTLGTAASILSVEGRHQTLLRILGNIAATPSPFDTPLSVRQVVSVTNPYIQSCPTGSSLPFVVFPPLTLAQPATGPVQAGSTLQLQSVAAAQGKFCAFTNAVQPGGTAFTPFTPAGGCTVPDGLAGIAYVNLAAQAPASGVLDDGTIVAGPLPLQIS